MKIIINLIILLLSISCSSTKPEPTIDDSSENKSKNDNNKENSLFIDNAEPFYPIKETNAKRSYVKSDFDTINIKDEPSHTLKKCN